MISDNASSHPPSPEEQASSDEFLAILRRDGFISSADARLVPLSGGVSSEIYRAEDGGRIFVVKRALARLRVEADWIADVSRNATERAFIEYVAGFRPDAVPDLLPSRNSDGYFCMEFLDGFANWKSDLMEGICEPATARRAGFLLGEIHSHSWNNEPVLRQFDVMDCFDQLRLDAYLRATARNHPALAAPICAEARRLAESRLCLMHGDFSPKNLLHRDGRIVIVDCETACAGDGAFDLAFLLNHILLKALHHAPHNLPLARLFAEILDGYSEANPANSQGVAARAATLLPMLLLARVDGKSPVEYLRKLSEKTDFVRGFASPRILQPPGMPGEVADDWFKALAGAFPS